MPAPSCAAKIRSRCGVDQLVYDGFINQEVGVCQERVTNPAVASTCHSDDVRAVGKAPERTSPDDRPRADRHHPHRTRHEALGSDILVVETAAGESRFANGLKTVSPLLRRALTGRHGRRVVDDGADAWLVEA